MLDSSKKSRHFKTVRRNQDISRHLLSKFIYLIYLKCLDFEEILDKIKTNLSGFVLILTNIY